MIDISRLLRLLAKPAVRLQGFDAHADIDRVDGQHEFSREGRSFETTENYAFAYKVIHGIKFLLQRPALENLL